MYLTEAMFTKLKSWELYQKLQSEKNGTLDEISKKLDEAINKTIELEAKNDLLETRMLEC